MRKFYFCLSISIVQEKLFRGCVMNINTTMSATEKLQTQNAVNSYNVPIHIIYDGTSTDVEHVGIETEATKKIIKDGQLYIIRNGKEYNVLGTNMK